MIGYGHKVPVANTLPLMIKKIFNTGSLSTAHFFSYEYVGSLLPIRVHLTAYASS